MARIKSDISCQKFLCLVLISARTEKIFTHTRAVQKVSDLWSAKIQLFIWMSETLIPFKVVSLVMHTLLSAVLPLLEAFLESFLWNHVQQVCRVPHNVFS